MATPTSISITKCLTSLKSHWGYDKLREHQYEICQAILSGKDVFVLMATGSGKSLSYQLPPVLLRDYNIKSWSLVICPLISLAEDQVAELNAIGIPAAMVGGSSTMGVERQVREGQFCVVYITPEKLLGWVTELRDLAKRQHLVCVAVDEAHCVSEWGHDFRPAYRNLQDVRDAHFPTTPLLALTATATHAVMRDISASLKLRSPLVVRTSFNRPNLFYAVKQRFGDRDIAAYVKKYYSEALQNSSLSHIPSTLVYVNTQSDAEKFSRLLQEALSMVHEDICVKFYHAGMSATSRSVTHQGFCQDTVHVIVATVAFGMGINKPDVRLIVHSEMPHSVEAYYQQTGRAGRDGFPSKCVLFHNRNDMVKLHGIQNFRSSNSNAASSASSDKLTCMSNYCSSNGKVITCRRSFLLKYFDDCSISPSYMKEKDCCDLCQTHAAQAAASVASAEGWISSSRSDAQEVSADLATNGPYDLGHEVLLFLRAVQECGGYFGLSAAVGLVIGSKDKSLQKIPGYPDRLRTHGLGKGHPKAWWTELGHAMVEEGLLATQMARGGGFSYQRFMVGEAGKLHLQRHRGVPMTSLMNLQAAREGDKGTSASAVLPESRFLEASKAFRIQLRFSPPFATAVAATRHSSTVHATSSPLQRHSTMPSNRKSTLIKSSFNDEPSCTSAPSSNVSCAEASQSSESQLYDVETLSQLESRLRQTRGTLGESLKLRPYNILSTDDLKNLVQFRPIDVNELSKVPGWGMLKIQKFGQPFVKCITVFMRDMGLPLESNLPPIDCQEIKEVVEDDSVVEFNPEPSVLSEDVTKAMCGGRSKGDVAMKDVVSPALDTTVSYVTPNDNGNVMTAHSFLNTDQDVSMWTVQNPFRQKKSESSCAVTGDALDHFNSATQSDQEVTLLRDDSRPSSTIKEEKEKNNVNDGVDVKIDMFGPISVAVHTSSASPTMDNKDTSPSQSLQGGIAVTDPFPRPIASHPPVPVAAKRKRHNPMSGIVTKKGTGSTRLKKSTSLPLAASSGTCSGTSSLQHPSMVPKIVETPLPSGRQLEASVLQFLTKHPRKTFSEIISGLLGGDAAAPSGQCLHMQATYAPQVREAIKCLSNDFCIYMDGDKYCAL